MSDTLFISDQRMLQLMAYQVKNGHADSEAAFCEQIGFIRQNLAGVRRGTQGFTKEHIRKACEVTGANANWIFGLEKAMFRDNGKKGPLQLLQEAVAAVEAELTPSKGKRPKRVVNSDR